MNTYHTEISNDRNLVDLTSFTASITQLRQDSENLKQTYNSGQPYPHVVIEDLFDPKALDRIVNDFPSQQNRDWIVWDSNYELKSTSKGIAGLSSFTQLFCLWLNSSEFIDEIKKITGIPDLVPDPLFFGAGLHEMRPGGWLDIHADYTKHPILPLIRRVNLLLYLNRDWDASWGGDIELWSDTEEDNRVSYPPNFNRTVIFPTTSETLHGVSRRLTCPPDRTRKLISIYYWSPAPSLIKAGTPIIWSTEQSWQKKLRKILRNVATNISGDKGNGFGL